MHTIPRIVCIFACQSGIRSAKRAEEIGAARRVMMLLLHEGLKR